MQIRGITEEWSYTQSSIERFWTNWSEKKSSVNNLWHISDWVGKSKEWFQQLYTYTGSSYQNHFT